MLLSNFIIFSRNTIKNNNIRNLKQLTSSMAYNTGETKQESEEYTWL